MKSHPVTPVMTRCKTCRRWWSQGFDGVPDKCGCGGELEPADMEAHLASLPKAVDPA